jgi:hypothetical protein
VAACCDFVDILSVGNFESRHRNVARDEDGAPHFESIESVRRPPAEKSCKKTKQKKEVEKTFRIEKNCKKLKRDTRGDNEY